MAAVWMAFLLVAVAGLAAAGWFMYKGKQRRAEEARWAQANGCVWTLASHADSSPRLSDAAASAASRLRAAGSARLGRGIRCAAVIRGAELQVERRRSNARRSSRISVPVRQLSEELALICNVCVSSPDCACLASVRSVSVAADPCPRVRTLSEPSCSDTVMPVRRASAFGLAAACDAARGHARLGRPFGSVATSRRWDRHQRTQSLPWSMPARRAVADFAQSGSGSSGAPCFRSLQAYGMRLHHIPRRRRPAALVQMAI